MPVISAAVKVDRKTINLTSLANLDKEFLIPAIQEETQEIALDENLIQMRAGNDPSRVVLDSRRSSGELTDRDHRLLARAANSNLLVFRTMDRRITFFYTEIADLAEAVKYAWRALTGLMLRDSGKAIESLYLWCSEPATGRKAKCETIGQAVAFLSKSTDPGVNVTILGPLTEYRRFVIYSHKGATSQSLKRGSLSDAFSRRTKAIDRYKFIKAGTKVGKSGLASGKGFIGTTWRPGKGARGGGGVQLARAVQELVKTRVQRQFRDVWVGYRFTRSREALKLYNSPTWRPSGENIFIPALFLGIKRLGAD